MRIHITTSIQTHKMHGFSLILLSIILHQLNVYSAKKNTSDNYLPLVFVIEKKKLQFPDRLTKATIDEKLGFTGDTQFSKGNSKEQMFFCPAESPTQLEQIKKYNDLIRTSSHRIVMLYSHKKASENCLFPKKFEKQDTLRCSNDAMPTILPVQTGEPGKEEIQKCGPQKKGILFKFVYEVCVTTTLRGRITAYLLSILKPDVAKFIRKLPFGYVRETVYEICYNLKEEKTIYTRHNLASSDLLFDEDLQHEKNKKFTMMTNANENFLNDEFSNMEAFYNRLLNNPTEQNQPSSDEKSNLNEAFDKYLAEKLVSPDDLPTAVLKKPTFHYINVKPMHEKLVDLWNYMAELVRKNFKELKTENPINIYTGAFTSTDSYHELPKDWPTDVPEIWVKIIFEEKEWPDKSPSLVILMKNEYKSSQDEFKYDYVLSPLCPVDYCEFFKDSEKMKNKFSHLLEKIRCCPFNEKIDEFFKLRQYLERENTLLSITNLTDNEEKRRED